MQNIPHGGVHLSMLAFMWQDDLIGVAKYVNACIMQMNPQDQASDQPGVADSG